MSIDPGTAAARVTAGVDWAKDDHAVCVAGGQGEALERFTVRHDAAGLRQMAARLLRLMRGVDYARRLTRPVRPAPGRVPLRAAAGGRTLQRRPRPVRRVDADGVSGLPDAPAIELSEADAR